MASPNATMSSHDSPFSNLDLFCDWTGDFADPVSVRLTVEVKAGGNSCIQTSQLS